MPAGVKRAKIMENSIINSLKRLERAGEENSKTNEKLFQATKNVADFICHQFLLSSEDTTQKEGLLCELALCDGYTIRLYGTNGSEHTYEKYLCKNGLYLNTTEYNIECW